MTTRIQSSRRDRAAGIVGALAVQLVLAGLFVWGLTVRGGPGPSSHRLRAVATVDLPPPPKPARPVETEPDGGSRKPPAAEREGETLPVVVPVAINPAPTAPMSSELADPRGATGTVGASVGAGGGGMGDGAGDGIATPARRVAGAIRDSDYPRDAERGRLEGTVGISFRVRVDGRVDLCTVTRPSGHAILDELTCNLFTDRYRFKPAMTTAGQPVESTLQTIFTWGIRRR